MTAPQPEDVAGRVLARLAEVEAVAKAATEGEWVQEPDMMAGRVWVKSRKWTGKMDMEPIFQVRNEANYAQREKDAAHITANDPVRVLREIEALRTVVGLLTVHRRDSPAARMACDEALAALAAIWPGEA